MEIRLELFEEHADPEIQGVLMEAGREFLSILAAGELPEADASESSYRALLRTTKLAHGKRVLLPGAKLVDIAEKWRKAKADARWAEGTCEHAKHIFAAAMADAEEAVLDDGSVVRRSVIKESTYTVERKASWRWTL